MLYRRGIKRIGDLGFAAVALVLAIPLLLGIALFIRLAVGGSVLFRQTRPGLHGRPFSMYKFRTMKNDRGRDGMLLPDEQRMTNWGRFLRQTSLDELPELINVLKGDMSLVGPRPLLMEYLPLYSLEQARRHEVRPGITGWAQVNGRNSVDWDARFAMDVWYVDNLSFVLDLKIIFLTVGQVFSRKGVSAAGYATMPKFTGSR